ncbi:MAG TPA: glycine oxidase ThiO [Pyrinomonadaceae bacterium]|nr:glycine oxidase ThiO [Pyrinomonadaceae bacterium]
MLKSDESGADVVVVGGGVAGLSAARAIARRGARVVVVENNCDGAASRAAAGMLAPQCEADRDDEMFKLLCASRDMYADFAGALLEETGLDIELDRTGTLYLALAEEDEDEMERRFEWQTRAGLEVERLSAEEARRLEPQISNRVRAALSFPRDWQVENRLLVKALSASVERHGARLLTETEARGVRVVAGRAAGVDTSRGFLSAGAVVLAAGARTCRVPLLVSETRDEPAREDTGAHPTVEPVRGQMLCLRQPRAATPFVRHVVYSPRAYIVPRRDGRLLAGSTSERAGFDSSVTAGGLRSIASRAAEIAPRVESLGLTDSWAGLRPRTADGRPLIGESCEVRNLFYATGYYRNGILLAPVTGEIVAGLVAGGTTVWPPQALKDFSPARYTRALAGSRGN